MYGGLASNRGGIVVTGTTDNKVYVLDQKMVTNYGVIQWRVQDQVLQSSLQLMTKNL